MLEQRESKLLKELALAHDELVEAEIAFTDSYIGEFGEFYACKVLNLTRLPRSSKGSDAIDAQKNRYQIKAKVLTKSVFNYTIRGLQCDHYDYLVIVHLNQKFELVAMYQIEALAGSSQLKVTAASILSGKLDITRTNLRPDETRKIERFAELYSKVKLFPFFTSANLVGCVGEYMAAKRLNLKLSNINQKGYDAIDNKGNRYEIKTRRVYSSTRRNSETRRINNLVGKDTDYLIIVVLDHSFDCAGMWLINPNKIVNTKSANLKIVNTTEDVWNLVPSKISYLIDRTPYPDIAKTNRKKTTVRANNKEIKVDKPVKQKNSSQKKYPAYYFVIPTMLIYYFVIRPSATQSEGILYYALIALFAWYLYRKMNEDPSAEVERQKLLNKRLMDSINKAKSQSMNYDNISRTKKTNIKPFKIENNTSLARRQRDINTDCECDYCLNGDFENCEH